MKGDKAGKIGFKADKGANLHLPIGKISFGKAKLKENGLTVISTIIKSRPAAARGTFIKSVSLSSTMGPGLRLDAREATSAVK